MKPAGPMAVFFLVQSILVLTAAGDALQGQPGHAAIAPPFTDSEEWQPLVGRFAFRVTTAKLEAQRLFGIGLLLIYNFDQPNARSAFKACLEEDPGCSMCWWGLAHSHGPFLNHPTRSSEDLAAGLYAAMNASAQLAKRRDRHTAKEQVLIDAMAVRYPAHPAAGDQIKSYKQYAKMLRIARESNVSISSDVDLIVFDAEARMVLMCDDAGYHFYNSNGDDLPPTPANGTAEISKMLRGVLTRSNQTHPYAQHLLIHSTEMSNSEAMSAVEAAAHLMKNMRLPLQNSHLQHMTSHTFFRTGFYHKGVEANQDAVDSDRKFLQHGKIPYGPGHNAVFLLSSALFAGEKATSYRYAQVAQQLFRDAPARGDGPNGRMAWSYPMIVAVRFGDWDRMTELDSLPPGNFSLQWPYGYGVVRRFAFSVAAAQLNRLDEAASNLRMLQSLLPVVRATEDGFVVNASRIANYTAAAALAHARGYVKESLELFGAAMAVEMGMPYGEPPVWLLPTRECYGQAQLSAGQPAEAERTFRAALRGYSWHAEPNCGWALFGLRESLRAQAPAPNRTAEIETLGEAIARAWSHADAPLASACPLTTGSGVVV